MTTFWYKPDWTDEDHDPATRELLPHAMPPGIYCEDEAAYQALLRTGKPRADHGHHSMFKARRDEDRPLGWMAHTLDGIGIRVATPAEAAILQTVPAMSPAEHLAKQQAQFEAALANLTELMTRGFGMGARA